MSRRMSSGLQEWNIRKMLSSTRWENDMFDVKAYTDRTLHYGENKRNIEHHLGISRRDRGTEQIHQREAERKREQIRRRNPNRQVGVSNTEMDRKRQAMRPGKRFSKSGHKYYEYRANRSDKGRWL